MAIRGNITTDKADQLAVESLCQSDVLSVGPLTQVNQVAELMLSRKAGSVVVVDGGSTA